MWQGKTLKGFLTLVALLLVSGGLVLQPARAAGQVGNGTPGSCTEASLSNALSGGGTITFNCGSPVVINITGEKMLANNTVVDGGGTVTLQGAGNTRLLHIAYQKSLTLKNITLQNATLASTSEDGGAAIKGEWQSNLTLVNVRLLNNTFTNNDNSTYDRGGAIFMPGGVVTVDNSEFSGNISNNSGGAALHTIGANLTVRNSTFQNNQSTGNGNGGAIYNDNVQGNDGFIFIQGSTFSGNTSQSEGGAIRTNLYNGNQSGTYDHNTFINNSVTFDSGGRASGGAVRIGDGRFTFSNSTFEGNSAQGQGGAIWTGETVQLTVSNSAIISNTASNPAGNGGFGGGIAINSSAGSNIKIVNTTLSGNRSGFMGGGMSMGTTAPVSLVNSTITNNYAWWQGGGLQNARENVVVQNTIVANNTANNGGNNWNIYHNCFPNGGSYTNGGNNLQYTPLNASGTECGNTIVFNDPKPGPLQNNGGGSLTQALLPGSPALNAGNNATCPPTDQRGIPRPQGGTCEIGAFEVAPPPTISIAFSPTSFTVSTTTSLIYTLSNPVAANLTNVSFNNTLPGAVKIANPAGLTNTCSSPGTVTAVNSNVSVSGVMLAPNQTCSITLKVTSASIGTYSNTTGPISALQTGAGGASNTAMVKVTPLAPVLQLSFGPPVIVAGATANLNFTLSNPNAVSLSGVTFSTSLPDQLKIASGSPLTACGGTLAATTGGNQISLSGSTLGGNQVCNFSVPVTGSQPGIWYVVSGGPTATESGPGVPSNPASLKVAVPVYSAAPVGPDNTLNLGAAKPNTLLNTNLTIANLSDPVTTLQVSQTSLTNAAFSVSGLPLNLSGGTQANLSLSCTTPASPGAITATLTLQTNNLGQSGFISYNLKCSAGYVVSIAADTGLADLPGTLSYILDKQALNPGDGVVFDLANNTPVTFANPVTLTVKPGVVVDGSCNGGPGIVIDGSGSSGDGLVLGGANYIRGLQLQKFGNRQLVANGVGGNQLSCMVLRKT